MLDLVLQTPGCLPPLLWGNPGIGKSQRIVALGKALGFKSTKVVIASIREPQDYSGMPFPENGHGVVLAPPAWAKEAAELGKVLVFHDEISCTPPATQAALLRVVHEGVVGDLVLPPDVRQIAAANPPEQAAGGWDLAAPLANRFVHLSWSSPTAKEWGDWLLGNTAGDVVTLVDLDRWERMFNKSKALVAAFIRKFPELLSEDPAKAAGRFPPAFATPRTWECATRLYATVLTTGRTDVALQLVMGAVGEGAATKFLTWVREADLPDPEELLKDPTSWKPDPNRPDATFAVLTAVAYAATEKYPAQVYAARWKAAWLVLERAMSQGKDLVVVSARRLAAEANRPKGALNDPKIVSIVGQLKDVVRESGLLGN